MLRLRAIAAASLLITGTCPVAFAETLNAAANSATAPLASELETVIVTGKSAADLQALPAAQSGTRIQRERFDNAPASSIAEVLALSPGVTFVQGNGPRDVSVSVRGSNNRQTFGVRNIKVFEDGFPVTQPDGLARTDLTDPHAYGAIDVVRGPSSAFYGNYATGGAIDFHTRSGAELHGVEAGLDAGSFGYLNAYAQAGNAGETYDYSVFAGNVRGSSNTAHTDYRTTTVNALSTFKLGAADTLTVKLIDNELYTDLALRLSLDQYRANPYQKGCADLSGTACASTSVLANGYNGARVSLSPEQAGLRRDDRRTIVGARWEHAFDAATQLRTQLVWDNRDIKQPTSANASLGNYPSFNFSSDLLHARATPFGELRSTAGVFYNYEEINGYTYNVTAEGGATLGALTQTTAGHHLNTGARLRGELAFAPHWQLIAGIGAEYTELQGLSTAYSYANNPPTTTRIGASRNFVNLAPELALQYRPTTAWTLHARIAAGYGTPQLGNLFVTPEGVAGNNTQLDPQRNLGYDIGVDWQLADSLSLSLSGFYEFFRDELVSQSAGSDKLSYTYNAPRSEHRGVELALDWHPLPNVLPGALFSANYLYNDQVYRSYTEVFGTSSAPLPVSRDGNAIPGVQKHFLNTRLGYDQASGALQGLGAYVELSWRDDFWLDNANLLQAPGYTLVNLNLHFNTRGEKPWSFYLAVQNLLDKTYVASASNLADRVDSTTASLAATSGSIYAGTPRTFVSGLRYRF